MMTCVRVYTTDCFRIGKQANCESSVTTFAQYDLFATSDDWRSSDSEVPYMWWTLATGVHCNESIRLSFAVVLQYDVVITFQNDICIDVYPSSSESHGCNGLLAR